MKKIPMTLVVVLLLANVLVAQNPDVKFIADTLVVQAEGKFEADPDLAPGQEFETNLRSSIAVHEENR